ncbi:g1/s-specific cyclin-e [Anaeramoeba ignava]|uniref:G1/s-specific cyclin-e n=1 Tax=Anaeramoeba ignava TaxID=1746090 RepID=A0A9Q0LG38_ANAIG|nr:g1/s-specific cyclin-e [Anaeramoeba ignava]
MKNNQFKKRKTKRKNAKSKNEMEIESANNETNNINNFPNGDQQNFLSISQMQYSNYPTQEQYYMKFGNIEVTSQSSFPSTPNLWINSANNQVDSMESEQVNLKQAMFSTPQLSSPFFTPNSRPLSATAQQIRHVSITNKLFLVLLAQQNENIMNFSDFSFDNNFFQHKLKKERNYQPDPFYIENQNFNENFRLVLVDWMSSVSDVLLLQDETFLFAVNFLDRFFSLVSNCSLEHLQLVGLGCLYIAAKIEEIYPPSIKNFSKITNKKFLPNQIKQVEVHLLSTLDFFVNPVTILNWVREFLNRAVFIIKNYDHFFTQTPNESNQESRKNGIESNIMDVSQNIKSIENISEKNPPKNPVWQLENAGIQTESDPRFNSKFSFDFPVEIYLDISELISLIIMDINYLQFLPSIIAATAMSFFIPDEFIIQSTTGYNLSRLSECKYWMQSFLQFCSRFNHKKIIEKKNSFHDDLSPKEAYLLHIHNPDNKFYLEEMNQSTMNSFVSNIFDL